MLVLTRKRDEAIKIGEDIIIKVIYTGKGSVKLGVEAPSHIRVLRAELTETPVASPMSPNMMTSDMHDELMLNTPMSAASLLREVGVDHVAEREDQLLVSTAS